MNYVTYQKLKDYTFVLASTSPRRLEILTELGIETIKVVASDFEENLSKNCTTQEYVLLTAKGKGDNVVDKLLEQNVIKPTLVLSSDTIVVCNGEIFEKPKSKQQQLENLKFFRSNPVIEVHTAVILTKIVNNEKISQKQCISKTVLNFDEKISDAFLEAYVESNEGSNVAGGFKIQGKGGLLFNSIQGDYNNVVGLPFKDTFNLIETILQ